MTEYENRQYEEYLKSPEWAAIAFERLKIDHFRCQMCGACGTATNKLEIHHLSYKYLYNEWERIGEDLVTVCHVCHKSLHRLMNRKTDVKSGRHGWKDNRHIPRVHAFNLEGELQYVEERYNDIN